MKPREIIITAIIISVIIAFIFLVSIVCIKKIRKILLIIFIPIILIIISFFAFAYMPRGISKKYLKDNPIKIYCCYADETAPEGAMIEIDINKKDEILKMMKKVYYVPYYHVRKTKDRYAITNYYCLQYEDYYIVIGYCLWKKGDGDFYHIWHFPADYKLIQHNSGTTRKMRNFDFYEWKKILT